MKASLSLFALAAALSIGLASAGSAHQEVAGNLKIEHPWICVAATGAHSTYAGIFEVKNDGDDPETLLWCDGGRSRHRRIVSDLRKRRPFQLEGRPPRSAHQATWQHRT